MEKKLWFDLIRQWKETGKGEYGITFPFLVGAISLVTGNKTTRKFLEEVFEQITNEPVEGFYCEVRWCSDINEPVFSIKPLSEHRNVAIKTTFERSSQVSVGFTDDIMGIFALDCETSEQCKEKIIKRAIEPVSLGHFSKNDGKFVPFTREDKNFIASISK